MGRLKARMINMLGRSIKNAKEPDTKVVNTKKAMKTTKPTKYIKNLLIYKFNVWYVLILI